MAVITIQAGQVSNPRHASPGEIISVKPGTGGSVLVEYTLGSAADIGNNVATWSKWPPGTVAVSASQMLSEFMYIRVTAYTAAAVLTTNPNPSPADIQQFTTPFSGQSTTTTTAAATFPAPQLVGKGFYQGQNASGTAGNKWNVQALIPIINGASDLQFMWGNFNNLAEGSFFGFTLSASIILSTGQIVPLTFNSSLTWVPTSASKQYVFNDVPAGYVFNPGDVVTLRWFYNPGTGQMPTGYALDCTIGEHYSQSSTDTDQTQNAAFAWPAPGVNQLYVYGPMCARGRLPVLNPSIAGVGDSILAAYGTTDCVSWFQKAMNGVISYSCLGSPGEDTSIFENQTQMNMREFITQLSTTVLNELIINSLIHNFDLPGIQSDLILAWRKWSTLGKKVYQTTASPYTNAGNTAPQKDAVRQPVNAWLRDGAPLTITGTTYAAATTGSTAAGVLRMGATGHPLRGLVDIASYTEVGVTGLWVTGFLYTGDSQGVHMNNTGRDFVAAQITPAKYLDMFSL